MDGRTDQCSVGEGRPNEQNTGLGARPDLNSNLLLFSLVSRSLTRWFHSWSLFIELLPSPHRSYSVPSLLYPGASSWQDQETKTCSSSLRAGPVFFITVYPWCVCMCVYACTCVHTNAPAHACVHFSSSLCLLIHAINVYRLSTTLWGREWGTVLAPGILIKCKKSLLQFLIIY